MHIEPLHGITFAVMWSAATRQAHAIAPPGLGTTMQGEFDADTDDYGWLCPTMDGCVQLWMVVSNYGWLCPAQLIASGW
jgi:hypothetical protein